MPRLSKFALISAELRKVESKTKKILSFLPRRRSFLEQSEKFRHLLMAELRKNERNAKGKLVFLFISEWQ